MHVTEFAFCVVARTFCSAVRRPGESCTTSELPQLIGCIETCVYMCVCACHITRIQLEAVGKKHRRDRHGSDQVPESLVVSGVHTARSPVHTSIHALFVALIALFQSDLREEPVGNADLSF